MEAMEMIILMILATGIGLFILIYLAVLSFILSAAHWETE